VCGTAAHDAGDPRIRAVAVFGSLARGSWDEHSDLGYSMGSLLWWPVSQWRYGVRAAVWWQHLERGMAAFDDLGCAELPGR